MLQRPLLPSDLPEVLAVRTAVETADDLPLRTPADEMEEELTGEGMTYEDDTVGIFDGDGCLAYAYAHLSPDPSAEGRWATVHVAVHPDATAKGIGRQLLQHVEERATKLLHAVPDPSPPRMVRCYMDSRQERAARMASRNGYAALRYYKEMTVDLASATTPDAPVDVHIQAWDPDRLGEALEVKNDTFADHWGSSPTTEAAWKRMTQSPRMRGDLSTMALIGDALVGFVVTNVYEEDWPVTGREEAWISLIGVLRAHRGRGVASGMISHTLAAVAAAGLTHASLGVDSANPTGALGLYTALGFVETSQSQMWAKPVPIRR